eukprot:jgi/Hompol1/5102/HPOL_001901-RA
MLHPIAFLLIAASALLVAALPSGVVPGVIAVVPAGIQPQTVSLDINNSGLTFGASAQPSPTSPSFSDIANRTWTQLHALWDDAQCGGGIPTDSIESNSTIMAKSAVVNAAFMALSADLFVMTGNTTYRSWADNTYNWMVSTGIVTGQFEVNQGLSSTCAAIKQQWSLPSGLVISALGTMYQATTLAPYFEQMSSLLSTSLRRFQSGDGVLAESLCDLGIACTSGQVWFKGLFVQALADAYRTAPNASNSQSIALTLKASSDRMNSSGQ